MKVKNVCVITNQRIMKRKNTKRILELNFKLLKKQLEQHKDIYMRLKDK